MFPISVSTLPTPAFTSPPPTVTVGSDGSFEVEDGGDDGASCRFMRCRKLLLFDVWVTDTGGETVEVPVPVLVAMDVAADCK
jgi:hypothetical protein